MNILQRSTLHWSGCQLDSVTVTCIQQCSEILLKLLKASSRYYETHALWHPQQCKYITFFIFCKQLPLSKVSSPASKYLSWNIQLSSWKLHSVIPLLLPVQSCGSNNVDFQPHGTPQLTLLYHTLPLLLPQPAWKHAVSHAWSDNKSQQDLLKDSFIGAL